MVLFVDWYGPEPVETSKSIRRACTTCNLHRKGGPAGGVPVTSPTVKLVSFEENNKDQLLMVLSLRTFLRSNCSVFIVGDHDDFPC